MLDGGCGHAASPCGSVSDASSPRYAAHHLAVAGGVVRGELLLERGAPLGAATSTDAVRGVVLLERQIASGAAHAAAGGGVCFSLRSNVQPPHSTKLSTTFSAITIRLPILTAGNAPDRTSR